MRLVVVEIGYEASVNPPNMTLIRRQILEDRLARLLVKEGPVVPEGAICPTEAEDLCLPLVAIATAAPISPVNVTRSAKTKSQFDA